jgi:hypothetical protein
MEKKQTNKKFYHRDILLTGITYGTYKYIHSLLTREQMMQMKKT